MNRAVLDTWRPLTGDGSVRWLKYSWGPVTANTLAVRLEDGTWLVVSPSSSSPPSALDELALDGDVSVLVAPNGYHHLGQRTWRARFPNASSYAPDGALARLAKKSPDVPYRPITELVKSLPSYVEMFLPEGQKSPDMLVRASPHGKTVWWMGDQFSNLTAGDQIWLLRVLAPLHDFISGSGLGYRRNGRPEMIYVRDRDSWVRSIRGEVEKHPPSVVVPAHGDAVVEDTARRTRELLRDAAPSAA